MKEHAHESHHNIHLPASRTLAIIGLFVGMLFSALDQTIVGTAMPSIIGKLGGFDLMVWVTTAYMLTSTSVIPIVGKLADTLGRRKMYLTGLGIFISGSILCGLSQSMLQLVIFRGLQGIGGGILMPMAMVVIGDLFTGEQRAKWQGAIGGVFGLAAVIGPQVGGWVVSNVDWRWVFYINIPFGLLATVLIAIGLSSRSDFHSDRKIDYLGAVLAASSVVCLLLALTFGGKDYAWISWQILGLLGAFALLTLIFGWHETRVTEPLLPLSLFKNRVFSSISAVGFLMGMGMFGAIMFIPLFMQGVVGTSATQAGATLTPMMVAMVITSVLGGRVVLRLGFRPQIIFGMGLMAVGFYLMSTMGLKTNQLTASLYMIVTGLGMGFVMPTLTLALQEAFPIQQRGVVTSASTFFRSIGATLGVTVFGAVLNAKSVTQLEHTLLPKLNDYAKLPLLPKAARDQINTMIDAVQHDPYSLYQKLFNPEAIKKMSTAIQDTIFPPLKEALSFSLHPVFLSGMGLLILGGICAYFVGRARVRRTVLNEEAATSPMPLPAME